MLPGNQITTDPALLFSSQLRDNAPIPEDEDDACILR
jgi:hypothetical protein